MKKLACAALTAVLAVGGCAGKVETVHTDAGFRPAVLGEGVVAVGGFVASPRLAADPGQEMPAGLAPNAHAAQSDAWADVLYGQFLAGAPELQVWPWDQVAARADSAALAAALAVVARGGVLQAAHLAALADGVPEVRFWAVARLDRNESSLHESTEQAARTSWERDGLDGEEQVRDRSLTTRRRIAVTLDVYDLQAGRSVWTATATREAKELYNFEDAEQPAAAGETGALPGVTVRGTPRQGPALGGVLEAACGKLVAQLVRTERE